MPPGLRSFFVRLRESFTTGDSHWSFDVPSLPRLETSDEGFIKSISMKSTSQRQEMVLRYAPVEPNRAIDRGQLHKYMQISFENFQLQGPISASGERTNLHPRDTADYKIRMLQYGISLNGVTYRFFGHSNSQLKSSTCYLFAGTEEEISAVIESFGDFAGIKTVAKKAKRIGLLFSAAKVALELASERCIDISDIKVKDYLFTDGCGLISSHLAKLLVQRADIRFRNQRFTPSVYQIRYRGYKGVLTLEPTLSQHLVHFRDSMRKFKGVNDLSFAVVDFARPYAFGFLNDEVILLLNALGITKETIERKQREHLNFLHRATHEALCAFKFLSQINETAMAERLLLEGLPSVKKQVEKRVNDEIGKMANKRGEAKCRILILRSRLLFGVCDPRNILKEGECALRVTMAKNGVAQTIVDTEVLVTRNPCLHPGDLQKFRAVQYPGLSHLVDCIVFPVKGKRPSADMMSGGDLDGDKFFVCWDPDLIPAVVAQPAKYVGPKEPLSFRSITYHDRLVYFASYTNASLGRVKKLYLAWARVKGPMSSECQELNYLFSHCVDGNRISVPSHLTKTPEVPPDAQLFILDYLHQAVASQMARQPFNFKNGTIDVNEMLLCRDNVAMSELELFQLTLQWCGRNDRSILEFLDYFDFNEFSDDQRAWIMTIVPAVQAIPSRVLNALVGSSILDPGDLRQFKLDLPSIRWKRLYSSTVDRMGRFLPSLARAMELFVRKLIVIQVDNRLSIAIYVPARLNSREEGIVNNTCRLFAFPHSKANGNNHRLAVSTTADYRLYYTDTSLQLYKTKRADTWVFLARPGADNASYYLIEDRGARRRQRQATLDTGENADCVASIALNKFSNAIARHVGRVNRNRILAAEVYVISNRDIRSLEVLDQWIYFVDTQETLPLFENAQREYSLPSIKDVDWSSQSKIVRDVVHRENFVAFDGSTVQEFGEVFSWLVKRGKSDFLRRIYQYLLPDTSGKFRTGGSVEVIRWMVQLLPQAPSLALEFSKIECWNEFEDPVRDVFQGYVPHLLKAIILCANEMQGLVLAPFQTVIRQAHSMSLDVFLDLVEYITLTVEVPEVALDLLIGGLEPESARLLINRPRLIRYFLRNCLGIAMEHIEEASESRAYRGDWLQLSLDTQDFLAARVRIDAQSTVRLTTSDHVCLQAAQMPQNSLRATPYSMHALVERAQRGTVVLRNYHPCPPFLGSTQWKLKHHGSFVTTRAAFEALRNFVVDPETHCAVQKLLLCYSPEEKVGPRESDFMSRDDLNRSQNEAVQALLTSSLICLWGPPGTGKTHTLAAALEELLATSQRKILVTAPTHNAVDNMLRAFLANMHRRQKRLPRLVRVSTEVRRVAPDLLQYTSDAMVGKDLNENPAARKKAQEQVNLARIVFTTCTGASLGLLRDTVFPIVVIDEASQQTEPQSLIPLCKGCERAILVGDHVQLRATVRPHAQLQSFDVSMFERLFNSAELAHFSPSLVRKVMLDTQYRMHASICAFSSREFYSNRLKTAVLDNQRPLPQDFPWPTTNGSIERLIFAQCDHPESLGGRSKSNTGQVALARTICQLLIGEHRSMEPDTFTIAALTPYTACVEALRSALPSSVTVSSIDGFQGREADIVVFVTTRSNLAGEIGFLRDMRRLNVVLTRAKAGLIVIGDKTTLASRKKTDKEGQEVDPEVEKAKRTWESLIESCAKLPSEFWENHGHCEEVEPQRIG